MVRSEIKNRSVGIRYAHLLVTGIEGFEDVCLVEKDCTRARIENAFANTNIQAK
jgi:hypothetical protein